VELARIWNRIAIGWETRWITAADHSQSIAPAMATVLAIATVPARHHQTIRLGMRFGFAQVISWNTTLTDLIRS
jgi:hypothetical protein